MNKIFISYRRADSRPITERMYDRLRDAFGKDNIFKDVHSISGAVDFREEIQRAVGRALVTLVVIGPQWVKIPDQAGHRRLFDPDDLVRLEVRLSLQRGIPVFPVLVGGAAPPSAPELPPDLARLSVLNAQEVHPDPYFEFDMNRLINDISRFVPTQQVVKRDQEHIRVQQLLGQAQQALVTGDYTSAGSTLDEAEQLLRGSEAKPETARAKYLRALAQLGGVRPAYQNLSSIRLIEPLLKGAFNLHALAAYQFVLGAILHDYGSSNGMWQHENEGKTLLAQQRQRQRTAEDKARMELFALYQPELAQQYLGYW